MNFEIEKRILLRTTPRFQKKKSIYKTFAKRTLSVSRIRGSRFQNDQLELDKRRNQWIRANNFNSDRPNRSLVYTRGTRSTEISRYLCPGRSKQGRVQSCALSPDAARSSV